MVTFDSNLPGTPASTWAADARLHDRPMLDLRGVDEVLVVAAHPDDETLGAGGLLAEARRRGIPTSVVVVTDGGAAGLADRRREEFDEAITVLGAAAISLGFEDGQTRENRDAITEALTEFTAPLSKSALIVAPWRGDGHRDHRVVGEIAASLADDRRFLEYPIWLWHWGTPDDAPWEHFVALPIDPAIKTRALNAYASQREGHLPVLRADFLENFERSVELFLESSELDRAYFESIHDRRNDPWGFETRWYEKRKRDITIASLPEQRYERGLEIGCSIGVLTEQLAERVDDLLAVDVSGTAVARAASRVGDRARVERRDVLREFPLGPFDLVVLSEVGYYFGEAGLSRVLKAIAAALSADGVLIACHWRHEVADYPLSGDAVHTALDSSGLDRVVQHLEKDFVLGVYRRDSRSVAERAGLA